MFGHGASAIAPVGWPRARRGNPSPRAPPLPVLPCLARGGGRSRSRAPAAAGRSRVENGHPAHAPRGPARAPARSSARRPAGSRRRAPRAGTSPTTRSTRVLPFVNRELGWDEPDVARERPLVPGAPRPLRRRRARASACSRSARRRRGRRASGSSATASSSRPTSSSTRRSGSAAARSTATSAACRRTASTCPFPDETFDVVYCVATLHHALDLGADGRRDGAGRAAAAPSSPG